MTWRIGLPMARSQATQRRVAVDGLPWTGRSAGWAGRWLTGRASPVHLIVSGGSGCPPCSLATHVGVFLRGTTSAAVLSADTSELGQGDLSVDGRATPSGLRAASDWLLRVVQAGRESAVVLRAEDSDIADDVQGAWPGMPYVYHRVEVAESCMVSAAEGLKQRAEYTARLGTLEPLSAVAGVLQPTCYPQAVLLRTSLELSAIAYWALSAEPQVRRARGLTLALQGAQDRRRMRQETDEDDLLLLSGLAHKLALDFVDDQGRVAELARASGVGQPMPSNRRAVEELIGEGDGALTYSWLSAESAHASLPSSAYVYDDDDTLLGNGLRWRDVYTCLRSYQAMRIRLCARLGSDEGRAAQVFYWLPWALSASEVVPDGEESRRPARHLLT